jgi:cardiolipin synthase A/B
VGLHRLQLLPDTRAIFRSNFEDIERARSRVWVETYILRDDRLGRDLGERLVSAAQRGVDVRLLIDASGSYRATRGWLRSLRRRGVHVRLYRQALLLTQLRLGLRNHSRITVIDEAAYVGGYNWARPWLPRDQGGEGWNDSGVRVEGPVVREFAAVFRTRWHEEPYGPSPAYEGKAHADVRLVSEGPGDRYPTLRAHLTAFARARRRIWIENAYFFPPAIVRKALEAAARRGVDVCIVLPGESDLPIIRRAARAEYARWLRAGLHVYEYQPSILHAKFTLVDDDWSAIGTFDLHPKSTGLAVETALLVCEPGFVAALADLFRADRAQSRRVHRREPAQRGMGTRVVDGLARTLMHLNDHLITRNELARLSLDAS